MNNAGKMLDLKSDMEDLALTIKNVGEDFDEALRNSVVKATGLIKTNQSLKEVEFTCKVIQEYLENGQSRDAGSLVVELSVQLWNLLKLLSKE